MSHTPGPWKVAFRKNSNDFSTDDVMSDAEPSRRICDVYGGTTYEPGLSNARLIAAAPEMFDALVRVLETIENSDEWWIDSPAKGGFDAIEIADILDKARGER